MAKKDYYDMLGVSKNAGKDEIKKAYKRLALKYHPDSSGDKSTEEKFKEISEAYAVLSDDEKKKVYDNYGHAGFDQRFSQEDIFRNVDLAAYSRIFLAMKAHLGQTQCSTCSLVAAEEGTAAMI